MGDFQRDYRPKSLKEYIGNKKLKDEWLKLLSLPNEKRPQVVLLYGDSGCGKTTFARILAKEYRCEHRDTVKGACGVCPSCQMIDEYILTGDTGVVDNIREVNIADQSGKRDLDSVIEEMTQFNPFCDTDWSVFILDECHQASEALQNRLLKIAEEPPKNVLLVFCTTEKDKIIPTLLNRCKEFRVAKPTLAELTGLLRGVCEKEGIDYTQSGLEFIAQRCNLTIRSSLSNLDRVVSTQGAVNTETASKVFDTVSSDNIKSILVALKNGDTLSYIKALSDIKAKMDLTAFLVELKNFIVRGVYIANGIPVEGITDSEMSMYRNLFGSLGIAKTCILLNRVLGIHTSSVEFELIALGYEGLKDTNTATNNTDNVIQSLVDELEAERHLTSEVHKTEEAVSREQGIENASKLTQDISLDELFSSAGQVIKTN